MSKPARFIFIGCIGLVAVASLVLVVFRLQKSRLSPQQEAVPKITEISHPLGSIEGNCLLVPPNINPKEGNFSHRVYIDPESIDTFTYKGKLVSLEVKEFENRGVNCKYYVVNLERGREKKVIWPVYLPWNFRLSESQSLGRSDTDAQILGQLMGEELTVMTQFEKQDGVYKFFSWKVEVL